MASCASLKISSTSTPSESWLVKCEPWEKDGRYKDFGGTWEYLNEKADQYYECAKRHNALVDFERNKVK